jgi:hypothetical protein
MNADEHGLEKELTMKAQRHKGSKKLSFPLFCVFAVIRVHLCSSAVSNLLKSGCLVSNFD